MKANEDPFMDCIQQNDIIDGILNTYKDDLGNDFEQYRNHVYRVFNFAIPYVGNDKDRQTLSVAAAFHDLGIWTGRTFDYLQPSIDLVKKYSSDYHLPAEAFTGIETIIREHHKLTKTKTTVLAEIFRQADLVDLSLGLIRCGRKMHYIRMIRKTFPNKGFHWHLFRLCAGNLITNPLRPLPMYKF
jgi:hypothetical protein